MRYPDHMDDIFEELTELTRLQRYTLKERFRFIMKEYRSRCWIYAILFHTMRATMTLGSLAVPALLSIQNAAGTASDAMYWVTWGLSLAVTSANGITTLFKLDKHFYMLHATAEKLRSETWQYVQLAGRYSGHHGHPHRATHSNQFVYYCTRLEKINMHRVEDEYITMGDDSHPPQASQTAVTTTKLVPSPPDPASQTPGDRRDSINIVEEDDEMGYTKEIKEAIAVQMSGLPDVPSNTQPLLPKAPAVQGQSSDTVGATV